LFLKEIFSLDFPFRIKFATTLEIIATLFISTAALFSKWQKYIYNYSSLEVIAGDTKNRTQTIIHVQITVKMWGARMKSKKRDKSRQVFFSFHPMSRKEAKGDSLALTVHSTV
jgi:hypothetical protein